MNATKRERERERERESASESEMWGRVRKGTWLNFLWIAQNYVSSVHLFLLLNVTKMSGILELASILPEPTFSGVERDWRALNYPLKHLLLWVCLNTNNGFGHIRCTLFNSTITCGTFNVVLYFFNLSTYDYICNHHWSNGLWLKMKVIICF